MIGKIKKPPYMSQKTYGVFNSLPKNDDYLPALNLLNDKMVMKEIWEQLEKIDKASYFACSIINGISFWGVNDGQTPSETYQLYKSSQTHLKKFLKSITQSSDLLYNYQMCFERAFNEERKYFQIDERTIIENTHFHLLIENIINQTNTWEKSDFNKNKDSIYPRKMNEESAYRTYLVRLVHETFINIQKDITYGKIADIVNVMLPDIDGLDETHVRKLV